MFLNEGNSFKAVALPKEARIVVLFKHIRRWHVLILKKLIYYIGNNLSYVYRTWSGSDGNAGGVLTAIKSMEFFEKNTPLRTSKFKIAYKKIILKFK